MGKCFLVAAFGAATLSFAGLALAQDITGAGGSFSAPLYARWAADYSKATGARISFHSVGTGAGIKQIESKAVAFGASDIPLPDDELAKKGLLEFPTAMGGVAPVVNIKGIAPAQLRLNGQLLGDIYLGKITNWSDPAIKALNPRLPLPDAPIAPVRRADGSGTTFIFTNYLSKANADWKAKVGEGTTVNWPTGAAGTGNEGVAVTVSRTPNSIGYVEYAYVKQSRMTYALMQNAAGNYVAPDDTSFKAAAASADWSKSFYQVITNPLGRDAWPITGVTYILMAKTQDKPAEAAAALKFFEWAFKNGDKTAEDLEYVPMPAAAKTQAERSWAQIKDTSGKPVYVVR